MQGENPKAKRLKSRSSLIRGTNPTKAIHEEVLSKQNSRKAPIWPFSLLIENLNSMEYFFCAFKYRSSLELTPIPLVYGQLQKHFTPTTALSNSVSDYIYIYICNVLVTFKCQMQAIWDNLKSLSSDNGVHKAWKIQMKRKVSTASFCYY